MGASPVRARELIISTQRDVYRHRLNPIKRIHLPGYNVRLRDYARVIALLPHHPLAPHRPRKRNINKYH